MIARESTRSDSIALWVGEGGGLGEGGTKGTPADGKCDTIAMAFAIQSLTI